MALATGTALLGAAGVGLIGSLIGGSQQARAAQRSARAQERTAQAQLAFARETQERAFQEAQSPQELAQLERMIGQQERSLAREERFLSKVDPTLIEASQQALRLLRGETAASVAPIQRQREEQRKLLIDQLRQQLGPGAETSSAGIQALRSFDSDTSNLISQTQQGTLGQLLGVSQSASGLGRQGLAQQQQFGISTAQGFGNIASRRANALIGAGSGVLQAGQSAIQSAGSQFVGSALQGQQMSQLFGSVAQAGLTYGLRNGFGGSSGSSLSQDEGFTGTVDPSFGRIS